VNYLLRLGNRKIPARQSESIQVRALLPVFGVEISKEFRLSAISELAPIFQFGNLKHRGLPASFQQRKSLHSALQTGESNLINYDLSPFPA